MSPQITLFAHGIAPNPPKVAILLEELKIDYAVVNKEFGDGTNGVKAPDFVKINPNGRVPAIVDHTNNDKIVWESGAILLYIAERFDPTGKFAGNALEQKSEVWQWLFFQVSGLGPTMGQVSWFQNYHPVKELHPSVLQRYKDETFRICGVLEKRLAEEGSWLALKRFTIADMAHFAWLHLPWVRGKLDLTDYPNLRAYCSRIKALPSVTQAYLKLDPPK